MRRASQPGRRCTALHRCLAQRASELRRVKSPMNLKSGTPYWQVRNGLLRAWPRLTEALHCDVLIVGAGITGALFGDHLTRAGFKVVVIDGREAAFGSTSASTAMLQYEIDTEMQALAKRYGLADAVLAYRSCETAIGSLQALARGLRGVDFQPMHSLYYASRFYHRPRLEAEAALRLSQGFKLELLDRDALAKRFGIDSAAGLLTPIAAEADPFQLAYRLLARIEAKGGRIHARTRMASFEPQHGAVDVLTDDGVAIHCRHLVLAGGYETQQWLQTTIARNRSSYAFVSEPLPGQLGVLKRTMIWESARPYLYVRRTGDERLLVGGEDDSIDIALKRDLKLDGKAERLLAKAKKLFPELPLRIAFAWAGTFAETEDGLPFFGSHPQHGPQVHFAMAYGGNGITYSLIGAEMFRDQLLGKPHPCKALFGFERLDR